MPGRLAFVWLTLKNWGWERVVFSFRVKPTIYLWRFCGAKCFLIEFVFDLQAAVSEKQSDFQNCHIWAWNLAICKKNSRSYIAFSSFLVPKGSNWAYLDSMSSRVQDNTNFQIPIGQETWPLGKNPDWDSIHTLSLPQSKLSLILLYAQSFSRYEKIFKLPYLCMNLKAPGQISRSCTHIRLSRSFLPHRAQNWAYYCSMSSRLYMCPTFNCHICIMKLAWPLAKFQSLKLVTADCKP